VADLVPMGHCNVVVMEVFSTITSPVFSELVIVLTGHVDFSRWTVKLPNALRMINKVKPFKLVFSLEAPSPSQWETQQLEGVLEFVTTGGFFDFLDPPPSIRIPRSRFYDWDSLWGRLVLIVGAKGSVLTTFFSSNLGVKLKVSNGLYPN